LSQHNKARLETTSLEFLLDAGSALLGGDLDAVVSLLFGGASGGVSLAEAAFFERVPFLVGVGADSFVGISVHTFQIASFDASSDKSRELFLEGFLILFLEVGHVVGNMATEDVLFVGFSIGFIVVAVLLGSREATVVVGDIKTTVTSTFHGAKDTGTSGGALQTDIQKGFERGFATNINFDVEIFTINFSLTFVVEVELSVDTTSEEETSAVGGGVVGQTKGDTITFKFVGVCRGEADIVSHISGEDLACDIFVGETNTETVFGSFVFVFILNDQTTTGIVVGLALSASLVLDLEALEISFVFHNFNEPHVP